jgi:glycosyltransferase involved in cell wall biosynthesis
VIFAPSEIAPLHTSTPVVVGFQNPNLFVTPQASEPMRQRLRFRALLGVARASARRADALVFVSNGFRRVAEPRLPRTSAPRFTVTVGIDRQFTSVGDAGPFESLRPYVLCVADVYPYKALPLAVDAFAQFAARRSELRLVLAGRRVDDRESARIDARIRAHDLTDRVTRLDAVSYEEMPQLYRGAVCFLFPSTLESLGLPPLEALACGVPVVAASASVLPDVLDGAALFFQSGNADAAAAAVERALTNAPDTTAVASVLAQHDPALTGKALAEVFRVAARD